MKRTRIIQVAAACLVLSGALGLAALAEQQSSDRRLLQQGLSLRSAGKPEQAKQLLHRVDPGALSEAGRERLYEALAALGKKTSSGALLERARARHRAGDLVRAKQLYYRVRRRVEASDEQRAVASAAIDAIRRAQDPRRGVHDILSDAGEALHAGDLDKAAALLEEAKAERGKLGWFGRDRLERLRGRLADRRAEGEKPAAESPRTQPGAGEATVSVRERLASARQAHQQGAWDRADRLYRRVLESDAASERVRRQARAGLRAIHRQSNGGHGRVAAWLADAEDAIEKGDLARARRALERVRESGIELGWFQRNRFQRVRDRLARSRRAKEEAESRADEAEPAPAQQIAAGDRLWEQGELDRAELAYRAALHSEKAGQELRETARSRLDALARARDRVTTEIREKLDEARAALDQGRLERAESAIDAVRGRDVELGWFDRERLESLHKALAARKAERRSAVEALDAAQRRIEQGELAAARERLGALDARELPGELAKRLASLRRRVRERAATTRAAAERKKAQAAARERDQRERREAAEAALDRAEQKLEAGRLDTAASAIESVDADVLEAGGRARLAELNERLASARKKRGAVERLEKAARLLENDQPGRASETLAEIDAADLPAERRDALASLRDHIETRIGRREAANLLERARRRARNGQGREAAELYGRVTKHAHATAKQIETARAGLASTRRELNKRLSAARASLATAEAALDAGDLPKAEKELTALRKSDVNLGWFNRQRLASLADELASRRAAEARRAATRKLEKATRLVEKGELDRAEGQLAGVSLDRLDASGRERKAELEQRIEARRAARERRASADKTLARARQRLDAGEWRTARKLLRELEREELSAERGERFAELNSAVKAAEKNAEIRRRNRDRLERAAAKLQAGALEAAEKLLEEVPAESLGKEGRGRLASLRAELERRRRNRAAAEALEGARKAVEAARIEAARSRLAALEPKNLSKEKRETFRSLQSRIREVLEARDARRRAEKRLVEVRRLMEQNRYEAAQKRLAEVQPDALPDDKREAVGELRAELARIEKRRAVTKRLEEAERALQAGNPQRAMRLFGKVLESEAATEKQRAAARAGRAAARRRTEPGLSTARERLEAATAALEAGNLERASEQLAALREADGELGWFERERLSRLTERLESRRAERARKAAEKSLDAAAEALAQEQPRLALDRLAGVERSVLRSAGRSRMAELRKRAKRMLAREELAESLDRAAKLIERGELAAAEKRLARVADASLEEAGTKRLSRLREKLAARRRARERRAAAEETLAAARERIAEGDLEKGEKLLGEIDESVLAKEQRERLATIRAELESARQARRKRAEQERLLREAESRLEAGEVDAAASRLEAIEAEALSEAGRDRLGRLRERIASEKAQERAVRALKAAQADTKAGRYAKASAHLERVEKGDLPKAKRETLAELEERIADRRAVSSWLADARSALETGKPAKARGLFGKVLESEAATEKQLAAARAGRAAARRRANEGVVQVGAKLDAAREAIEAGNLDRAASRLAEVRSADVELGWFAEQRLERMSRAVSDRRMARKEAAEKPAPDAREPKARAKGDREVTEPAPDADAGEAPATRPAKSDLLTQAKTLFAEQKVAEAQQAEQEGNYSLAVDRYKQALAVAPGHEAARKGLERARAKERETEAGEGVLAEELAKTELRRQATGAQFESLMDRARERLEEGDFAAATEAVQQAKIVLDRNQRFMPAARYRRLRQKAVDLSTKIEQQRQKAEAERRERIRERREEEARQRREKAQREQREEVQKLLRRAADLRKEQKYDRALELLNQALFIDPDNVAAEAMKEMVSDAKRYVEAREIRRKRREKIGEHSIENLAASVPYNELMTFPADWPELTARRLGDKRRDPETKANQRTRQKLEQELPPVEFRNTKLESALSWLRQTTGIQIFVNWGALERAGVEKDTLVALNLSNVSGRQTLDLVLEQATVESTNPPSWTIVDGIVRVSTEQDLTRNRTTSVYDVRDLLVSAPDVEAPSFEIDSDVQDDGGDGGGGGGDGGDGGGLFGGDDEDGGDQEEENVLENIQTLIQESVGEAREWGAESRIVEFNNNLIVRTTPSNHREITQLLDRLRETRQVQISVEARLLLVTTDFLNQVGLDIDATFNPERENDQQEEGFSPLQISQNSASLAQLGGLSSPALTVGSTSGAFQFLDDMQVNLMLRATQKSERSISLEAPRITFLNGGRAFITVRTNQRFISDLQVVPDSDQVDVQVGQFSTGFQLTVQGTVSADRRFVTLSIKPSFNSLEELRTFTTSSQTEQDEGDGVDEETTTETRVQLPEIQQTQLDTTVSVPDRGTLLLGGQRVVREQEVEAGVPVLSKVPVLNRLFTNRGKNKEQRTLLILVKPTIIMTGEEERKLFPGLEDNPAAYQGTGAANNGGR